MSRKAQIEQDLKTALLNRRSFDVQTLRGLKAAILDEEVATGARQEGLSDEAIEKIVAREVKKRHESAALYDQNSRDDAASDERREATLLERYLPTQLTEAEVQTIIDAKIAQLGATDSKQLGQVIGLVKKEVGNQTDGGTIARLTKERLGN